MYIFGTIELNTRLIVYKFVEYLDVITYISI